MRERHTDRWGRALLVFVESVAGTSLTAMTAAEAQGFVDRGWARRAAGALKRIEAAARQSVPQPQLQAQPEPRVVAAQQRQAPRNRAPTVAAAIAVPADLQAGGTQAVSLAGMFSDPEVEALSISAASSDGAVVTASTAADGSAITLTGVAKGAATITVAARDTDGNQVADAFDLSVVAAPEPEQTSVPDVVARQDANNNGVIEASEYIRRCAITPTARSPRPSGNRLSTPISPPGPADPVRGPLPGLRASGAGTGRGPRCSLFTAIGSDSVTLASSDPARTPDAT